MSCQKLKLTISRSADIKQTLTSLCETEMIRGSFCKDDLPYSLLFFSKLPIPIFAIASSRRMVRVPFHKPTIATHSQVIACVLNNTANKHKHRIFHRLHSTAVNPLPAIAIASHRFFGFRLPRRATDN